MSAPYAPTGPIQFRPGPASETGADTFNAASRGEYEISASAISTASVMHKNPTSSLSRLFSVGVRRRTKFSSALGKAESCDGCVGASARPPGGTPNRFEYTRQTRAGDN